MGFLDRLFGTEPPRRPSPSAYPPAYAVTPGQPGAPSGAQSADQQAIERYRYLLRTAPPQAVEQVHAEAFAALTPAQRQQVLADLSASLPPYERPVNADPDVMARAATRAEFSHPGFMERTFSNQRSGPGFGSMLGASILGSVIGYVATSAIMSAFIDPGFGYADGFADGTQADAASQTGADPSATDFGGSDFGGSFGDFGGGDFGGFDI